MSISYISPNLVSHGKIRDLKTAKKRYKDPIYLVINTLLAAGEKIAFTLV